MTYRDFFGLSGTSYRNNLCSRYRPWAGAAGNYILLDTTNRNQQRVWYVGQTDDLARRMSEHEAVGDIWGRAYRSGAGNLLVFAHRNDDTALMRKREEEDLIEGLKPMLNIQHQFPDVDFLRRIGAAPVDNSKTNTLLRDVISTTTERSFGLGLAHESSDPEYRRLLADALMSLSKSSGLGLLSPRPATTQPDP